MKRLGCIEDFQAWQVRLATERDDTKTRLHVCDGTGCRALGSQKVLARLQKEVTDREMDLSIEVVGTGCPGFCECGPLVTIYPERISYQKVRLEDVPDIVERTLVGGEIIDRLLYSDPLTGEHIHKEEQLPFYRKQVRSILDLNGLIDPTRIEDYVARGGYASLVKVLQDMSPEAVIEEVRTAGLRGRGGAGFPTGVKWQLCRESVGSSGTGYIICNADEGDPGAFMDRSVVEGNPHLLLEGMLIGAYAIGVRQGYVYIRAEYPLAV